MNNGQLDPAVRKLIGEIEEIAATKKPSKGNLVKLLQPVVEKGYVKNQKKI